MRAFMKGPSLGINRPDKQGALLVQTSKSWQNARRLDSWYWRAATRSALVTWALLNGDFTISVCQTLISPSSIGVWVIMSTVSNIPVSIEISTPGPW